MVRPSDYIIASVVYELDEEAHQVAQAGVERYQRWLDDLRKTR